MTERTETPWLGVAYYPEAWPEEEMEGDIRRMKEIGVSVVRIAEFAWHRMEPKPGEFDFAFFHGVMDRLEEAGISVVLGTPTATPPRWLGRMYPDIYVEKEDGRVLTHGHRRSCCSNNAHYRFYCMRLVERMAREFADDPRVIGWQIDNEIYTRDMGCFCPDCQAAFRERLRKRYGSIDKLNEAWDLDIFSQWYDDFSDIPAPRNVPHNPHVIQAWREFQNDSHIDFVHQQADILHRYVKVPVGTDIMPFNAMDYRRLNEKLDVVEFNHYNVPEDLYACAFWFDYLRTLKEKPFWNTETATCWNGSVAIRQSLKPEGFCRANSWLPVAMGAEANMYWPWRTHWGGRELTHGAVLDASGRDMHIVGEVMEVAQGFRKAAEFIRGTRVKAESAIHFTSLNWNMNAAQSVVGGLAYMPTIQENWYKPAIDSGLRLDVIDAAAPLDPYKLVFSPLMMSLEEHGLPARIARWVRGGGVWVAGPLTDIRNADGARYRNRFYGMLEELTGVKWRYGVPDAEGRVKACWEDGTAFEGRLWFEMSDPCGNEALVHVTEGHSTFAGKALVVKCKVGKGCVILLGTIPSSRDMKRIVHIACMESGVEEEAIEGEVMVVPRTGEDTEGLILVEHGAKEATCQLPCPMTDLLTGRKVEGRAVLTPYQIMVLEK